MPFIYRSSGRFAFGVMFLGTAALALVKQHWETALVLVVVYAAVMGLWRLARLPQSAGEPEPITPFSTPKTDPVLMMQFFAFQVTAALVLIFGCVLAYWQQNIVYAAAGFGMCVALLAALVALVIRRGRRQFAAAAGARSASGVSE